MVSTTRYLGEARAVRVVGTTAYVGDLVAGLRIFDLSAAGEPKLLSSIESIGAVSQVQVVNNTAYVIAQVSPDAESELFIVDVQNNIQPQILARIPSVGDVALRANRLYLTGTGRGAEIYDVTDPASPQLVGQYNQLSTRVAVRGNSMYAFGGDKFAIVDISNEQTPQLLGELQLPGFVEALRIDSDLAYVVVADKTLPNGDLLVVDVSTPSAPAVLGQTDIPFGTFAMDLDVVGGVAYVAVAPGISVLNVRDPSNIRNCGSYSTNGVAGLDVGTDGIYAAATDGGVQHLRILGDKLWLPLLQR